MQPLASGRVCLIPCQRDHLRSDSGAAGTNIRHHVLDPGVNEAVPEDIGKADKLRTVPGGHPAQAVALAEVEPIPLLVGERSMSERGRMQGVHLGVREISAPCVFNCHA